MAAITTAAAGNWSATATWTGGVVPGNGDTVIITKAVTVNQNVTVGASNGQFVSGTTPAAIQVNSGGSLNLSAGVTLQIRGDLVINTGYMTVVTGVTFGAGSGIEFDSSQTSPTSTAYRWLAYASGTPNQEYGCSLIANGTQANPCFIRSNAGGANAYYSNGSQSLGVGNIQATWMTFTRFGDASHFAWQTIFSTAGATVHTLQNVTFDTCGQVNATNIQSTGNTYSWTNVLFVNTLSTTNNAVFKQGTFTNVVFDAAGATSGVNTTSAVFTNCYWQNNLVAPSGNYSMSNIFIRQTIQSGWRSPTSVSGALTIYDNGLTNNPQYNLNWFGTATNTTWSDIIIECTAPWNQGDSNHIVDNPPSSTTYTIRRTLHLPNCAGDDSGTPLTFTGATEGGSNCLVDMQHCTFMAGSQGAHYGETHEPPVGSILAFKNNIAWNTNAQLANPTSGLLVDLGHVTTSTNILADVVSPTNADYNCTFQVQHSYPGSTWFTNQGKGYCGKFSATPGAHDLTDVNPAFYDASRCTATFDTAYLGNTAPTWASQASGHAFAVGDFVSNNNAIFYGGAVINFRCIQAHTKGTTNAEPGNGTGDGVGGGSCWQQYWELATFYRLRTNLALGSSGLPTTYTDSSLGLSNTDILTLLRAWIVRGYSPTNPALANAGSDGVTIGAAPFYAGTGNQNQNMTLLGSS